jgi:hypothetical protein
MGTENRRMQDDPTDFYGLLYGLNGLPESVEATFPNAIFQTCIVHYVFPPSTTVVIKG